MKQGSKFDLEKKAEVDTMVKVRVGLLCGEIVELRANSDPKRLARMDQVGAPLHSNSAENMAWGRGFGVK